MRLNHLTKHPRQNSNRYDFGEDLGNKCHYMTLYNNETLKIKNYFYRINDILEQN